MFQSLIGIMWCCNSEINAKLSEGTYVSIPNRDYVVLQPASCESIAVFGFQGSVALTCGKDSFSDLGLSRGRIGRNSGN